MTYSYEIKPLMNKSKEKEIIKLFEEASLFVKKIHNIQWRNFFITGKFYNSKIVKLTELNEKYPNLINTKLSERYKRNLLIQTTGILSSYLSNRKKDYNIIIYISDFDSNTKHNLYLISTLGLWFTNTDYISEYIDKKTNKKVKILIPLETIKLARKIFKNILKNHNKPSKYLNYISINQDVLEITNDGDKTIIKEFNENGKKVKKKMKKNTIFDYWLNLSTLTKGNKINIPFNGNKYLNKHKQQMTNHLQISKTLDGDLKYVVVKELPNEKQKYKKKLDRFLLKNNIKSNEIGIDLGLRILLTTSNKKYYGKNWIDYLTIKDKEIQRLFAQKQKHNLTKSQSRKYKNLVKKIQDYIKNEINKYINQLIKKEIPSKLILESLNFQSPKLNKRMNRILSNFGKKIIKQKLERINEKYGIEIEYINPSYTSQECSCCGYVSKSNRKTQSDFTCEYCNILENIELLKKEDNYFKLSDFINNLEVKYTKRKNSKDKGVKSFYYQNKKLKMNLIKINADYNASKQILWRSSSNNSCDISKYDKKTIVLGKIIDRFFNLIPKDHNSLVQRLDNPYINKLNLY